MEPTRLLALNPDLDVEINVSVSSSPLSYVMLLILSTSVGHALSWTLQVNKSRNICEELQWLQTEAYIQLEFSVF